jgi:hypothetical protein
MTLLHPEVHSEVPLRINNIVDKYRKKNPSIAFKVSITDVHQLVSPNEDIFTIESAILVIRINFLQEALNQMINLFPFK